MRENPAQLGLASREMILAGAALERRSFLRLLGAGAGLGLLPSGCTGVPPGLAPPPELTLRALSTRTYAVFTAAAARIVGPRGAELIADRTVDVGRLGDEWLARSPAVAAPLGQALLLLEYGVWPLVGKLRPFTTLPAARQDRVLEELMTSRLELKRAVFRGVRSFALLAFYGSEASHALTGYPGPFGMGGVTIADAMRD